MWPGTCVTWHTGSVGCDLKSERVELNSASWEDGWHSLARRGLVSGEHVVWGRWKSQEYLSPYVEKPLNSKVIKSFVPELRSCQVFFVFRDSYVLCIYVMNILCTFPIFMYGYVTNSVCYCYTSFEMTDQCLWFQLQMNTYSSNWNTPY